MRGVFRFERRVKEATRLRTAAAVDFSLAEEELVAEGVREASLELLRQIPPMRDRDEAVFLLHTAAEIEHSLLAQYLYAAFSLTGNDAPSHWRRVLLAIAREEMGHLITVQNCLLALGGPLNFEREDYPFNEFYPFPFRLEPFTAAAAARYVLAEMPRPEEIPASIAADLPELRLDAGVGADDMAINRVGLLFEQLADVVGRLSPADFRPETAALQATFGEWAGRSGMIVETVSSREAALEVLEEIGEQGEGPGNPDEEDESHFARLYALWKEIKEGGWEPARPMPVDPTTIDERADGYISQPLARAWADLFDTRYRRLLADLGHSLLLPRDGDRAGEARQTLIDWCLEEMFALSTIHGKLAALPQHSEGGPQGTIAGPPFRLPFTLNLPHTELDRWRHHEVLHHEAADRIATVRNLLGGAADTHLERLAAADGESLEIIQRYQQEPPA